MPIPRQMVPRRPGGFARKRYRTLVLVGIGVLVVAALLMILGFSWWPFSLLGLLLIKVADRVTSPGTKLDPQAWLKGARGEESVGRALAELRVQGYRDLHDIETGHGNIDHVVVGPTGVAAVETKNWTGTFVPVKGHLHFNGRPCQDVLKQAQRGAMEIRRRLEKAEIRTFVDAVVVSTNAPVARGELTFREATVLEVGRLPGWVRSRRHRLTEAEIARAVAAILRGDNPVSVRSISHEDA